MIKRVVAPVRLTFTTTTQVKRTNNGVPSLVVRESNAALLPVESLVMLMCMVRVSQARLLHDIGSLHNYVTLKGGWEGPMRM